MQIFLAGGEAWSDTLLKLGVRNTLYSYYYFRSTLRTNRGKAERMLDRLRLAKQKGYRFMLDSGAFTYQEKGRKGAVPPAEAYFDEYYNFLVHHGDAFDVIVEFDIDGYDIKDKEGKFIETSQVDAWTEQLMAVPSLASKIMPVYHGHRGQLWLRDWLTDTRSPYIGLASSVREGIGGFLANAHRFGKFVHGFGQTKLKTDMKYTPFDSVDSSTWLRADKYGGSMIFQNNRLIVLDNLHKAQRALYREWYKSWGLDYKKIIADDLEENRHATIICWRELISSYEQKWAFQGAKYPYLREMHLRGTVPSEHPLVTSLKARKAEEKGH